MVATTRLRSFGKSREFSAPDLELAHRAAAGEMSALEELYRLHKRRVYSLCLRMIANTAEAEDLTQEVFIKLFYEVGTFRGESAFTTWLHRLTVNVVLMYLRKHKTRFERPTMEIKMPEQDAHRTKRDVQAFNRVSLDRALAKLPCGYRVVFVLFDVEGYTHDEINAILGCSAGTSKSQLHKARTKLRSLLRKPQQGDRRRDRAAPRDYDLLPRSLIII